MSTKKRVLFVDDEPDLTVMYAALLSATFTVEMTNSGAEALKRIEEGFIPEIVVSDVKMDGMDGFQLCREIFKKNIGTQLILVSGNVTEDQAKLEDTTGVYAIMEKPFAVEQLVHIIQAASFDKELSGKILRARTIVKEIIAGTAGPEKLQEALNELESIEFKTQYYKAMQFGG